jgi:menaquinone-specific isochorismate synthase
VSAILPRPAAVDASGLPDAAELVATSRSVDPSIWSTGAEERLAEAADRGALVAGRERLLAATGVAAALPLQRGLEDAGALSAVRAWLAAVEHRAPGAASVAEAAPGPIALGAFAFDRAAPALLVVPAVTWCRDADGRTWLVEVRRRDAGAADPAPGAGRPPDEVAARAAPGADPGTALDAVALRQEPSADEYVEAVARAVADIREGRLLKVVLARMVELQLPAPAVPSQLLAALWGGDRVFSPFSVPTPAGRLVGASPELVVSRRGRSVTSHAFAGTVPLFQPDGDAAAERLFDSEKDRSEHRLVVDEIVDALQRRCATLAVPAEPTVVRLRSDARLGTLIRGTLTGGPSDGDTVLELLALLHPTPAVGGVARAAALGRISALEPAPRGYWAGAVGWTDGAGDGEWVLGIRSVELDGRRALVRAGAGIVAESDPEAELEETTVKLRPVLDALWPRASTLL